MLKKHSQLFEGLFTASDLLVVSFAWTFSYWLRFSSGLIPIDKGIPLFADYLKMLIFVWLIWAFVYRRFGLYKAMRGVSRWREVWLVVKANSLSIILLLAVTYLFREKSVPFSRLVFAIFWFVSTISAVGSRSFIRGALRFLRSRGYNRRHVLIVGAGALAGKVARRMIFHPEYGLELVGCLCNEKSNYDPLPRRTLSSRNFGGGGVSAVRDVTFEGLSQNFSSGQDTDPTLKNRIIGNYEDLPKLLQEGEIDQIVVALPLCDHNHLHSVIKSIGDSIVEVKIVPDVHEFIQLGALVEELDGMPVVSLASTPLIGINRVTKRIMDLTLGTLLFAITSPLMAIIALFIRVTSKGPIFFSQERVGLDGKTFNIFKFRTMKIDAEKEGAQFARLNDPRTTTLGRILRRLNLDELPQLVNVIYGQMSLVGPRPERPVFIKEFRQHVPRYMLRHKVQAGMTGWAQVHGWRGNTSIERRIEHDLYYIEHWSIWLDLKILLLTLVNGFRDRNAY